MTKFLYHKIKKEKRNRYNPFYLGIFLTFSLALIFSSIEIYKADFLTIYFNKLLVQGLFHPRFFSIVQLLFLLIIFFSSYSYFYLKKKYSSFKERIFLYIIILFYILNMINPNNDTNNPILGMPLLRNMDEYLLIILVIFYTFLSKTSFLNFIHLAFKLLSFSLIIRAIFLLGMYISGNGQKGFYGVNSTLTESDSLFLYSIFQIIYFGLFLIYKKKYLFWISVFLFVFIILSYRRTFTFMSFIGTLTILLVYFIYSKRSVSIIFTSFMLLVLIYPASNYLSNLEIETNNRILKRILSALPNSKYNTSSGEFSDSGHWDQTINTTVNFFTDDLSFWGTGYGNSREGVVEGQSVTIHNIFVATWAYVGFYLFCFIIFLVCFVFYNLKYYHLLIANITEKNTTFELYFLKIIILIVFFYYLFSLSFASIPFFNSFKMEFFWISFIYLIIKVDLNTWTEYFQYNK